MKVSNSVKLLALPILVSTPFMANASGIFLQEAVTANAGTATAGDGVYTESAAAMWANPATMSHMGESLTTINTLAFDLKMNYGADAGEGNGSAQSYLPALSVFHAHQLNDDVHLGLALGVSGGSSLSYGDDWEGAVALDSISLNVLQMNPSLSFKVTEKLSVGVGVQLSWAALEQDTSMLDTEQDSDWAYGFNAGVMYRYSDDLDLGFSIRSKYEHEFNLDIKDGVFNSMKTDVTMPTLIDFSTRWAMNEKLNLLGTVQWHQWSEWDSTEIQAGPIGANIERDWDNVWKLAVGLDYQLNNDWRLKTGMSYETSPLDDASKQWVDVPVGEQWRYSVGASTHWDDVLIDVFYQYADFGEMDINRDRIGITGTFDGRIHFVGVSFSM